MNSKGAMIIGGSNGIGLAIAHRLISEENRRVIIVDKCLPEIKAPDVEYLKINLEDCDFRVFDKYQDIDTLIITAGFGRPALFETITDKEIEKSFSVNTVSLIRIIKKYYKKLCGKEPFNCVVMGSIAGLISSPVFALYGATKAALCSFTESINIELKKAGTANRILNVSPGSIKGTRFNGGENNIDLTFELAGQIINKMYAKEELFIPDYEEVYKAVIEKYRTNPAEHGLSSYDYKMNSGRINNTPQIKVGYLSGTFDLFHIGHLNLLSRAKQYCDYLVVGVHKDASHKGKTVFIPFEERMEIVKSIKYVDEVIESMPEDCDVYENIKYDFLFVGSDYKGTERFNRYEEYFRDKNVEIVYFPYTKGTSSSMLREEICSDINHISEGENEA